MSLGENSLEEFILGTALNTAKVIARSELNKRKIIGYRKWLPLAKARGKRMLHEADLCLA